LAGDEKEAVVTLGPHWEGVLGREGAKLETGMGARHETDSPCAIYIAEVGGERAGGEMGTVISGRSNFNSFKADIFGRAGDETAVSGKVKGEMDDSALISKAEEDRR
jgi:hypothetical protein